MESNDPYTYFLAAVAHFERRKGRGFRKDIAGLLDRDSSTVTCYLGSKKNPARKKAPFEHQVSIAEFCGRDYVDFLDMGRRILAGEEVTSPGDLAAATGKVKRNGLDVRILGDVNGVGEPRPCRNPEEDYLGVPLYEEGRLSAGNGGMALDPWEKPASHVVIYRPELRGRAAHTLAAFRVGGDSMLPTIPPGGIVVADLSDRNFLDRHLYVVNNPSHDLPMAAVKRVSKFSHGFLLLSDNKGYPPETVEMEWQDLCVGRVVWGWRSLEDG